MPARLGEIDGIVHPMPIRLSDEAKKEYPIYEPKRVLALVKDDNFLKFIYNELGQDEEALLQIYSAFVLEDDQHFKRYNES